MSGFPWTSLITAVVPAAAVLAGAALTGRQNNQAGQTAALKADYAAFVQAVTVILEHLDEVANRSDDPRRGGAAGDPEPSVPQLVSAVALARAVVDLAGSYGARRAARFVSQAALGGTIYATDGDDLRAGLKEFLSTVRPEVGGESRPGLKWIIQNLPRRWRRHRGQRG